jgi:outer membrane protein assembly factor BamB
VGGPFDHRGVFKPYYDFIKDVPLTNGRYVDAQATATNSDLRVMGQKDLAGGKAHLWIQNRRHTWKNVVDGLAMGAPSGAVSVGGFQPTSAYTVQWFDTRTGQVASTRSVTSSGQGTLSLAVDSVAADLAVKISGAGGTPPPTEPPPTEPPPTEPPPTEPPPTGDSSAGWPMAGANPERTSWVSGTGIKSGDVEWFKPFESYISQRTQIIATQDTLFISTSDGLYALDAATGNQKWVYATAMPLGNSPTVAGSVAYVGGTDKKLHAVNVTNGSGLWTFDADGGFLTNPLVVNGIVYAGARDGYLYAVDAADGSLRWKYKTGGEILFSAAYKDGAIYFASNDMRAYALNASTGALIWRSAELPTAGFYSWWPVVHDDAVIIVGTPTYQIHRFGNIWPDTLVKLQIEAYGKGPESPVRSRTGKIEASGPRQIPRGTTVGPMTSVEGNWAPGTAVIDLSKPNAVPGGSTMAVTEYFEQRPYRRTYFVLDRQTGEEKTYDFDGDGQAEYAPILHSGTHSGTRYPPIVGGDGVLYQKTSYLSDQFIPGGHIAGWKYGTPYMSLPAKGSGSNYYWLAEDEPAAYSAIGNVIYYNLCCDRIGAWLDTSKPETPENAGEFFTYSNGFDRSLYEKIPGYRKFWYNPDESNTNAVCGTPEGCYGAFGANSPYGWHGNQNPPVPYKGRVYMHRGNSVIAIGTAGGRVQKPAATAASASYSVNIPSKNELQDKLDGEITKMIDAGHLRPGSVNLGLATGTGACGTQLADYFHDPSETIHALMLALPHVSSNVQGRLRAYIQQEMASYPPYRYEHLGFSSGAKRERYPTPPDLAPVLAGISPSDEDYTEFPGYGRNPFMFYAMWEYARELGGARELFDASSGYLESPPSDSYLKENPNVFNQYVAGYYGYLQLESLAGDPESRSVRSEYDRLLSLRISTFTKDSSYAGANASEGDVYCRGFNVFSNFLYLTPELASSLRSRRSQVSAAVAEYERVAPFWFVSNVDEGFGENAISWLHDTNGIYMAKAWILQEPYAELARYIDNPGFERGDLFYIQKLVAALEAP